MNMLLPCDKGKTFPKFHKESLQICNNRILQFRLCRCRIFRKSKELKNIRVFYKRRFFLK